MATFQKVKLGDIANEDRDTYLPSAVEDIPYIGLEHIEQQTLRLSGIGKSSDAMSQKKKFIAGDVLYGSLRPYFRKVYKPNFDGVCSTDITVLKSKSICDNSYLFYLIASPDFISKASGAGTGTKMPRAGWKVIKDFMFDVPGLPTQTHIASVLSVYDDLIENNEKRIKVLEEMAQLLYTEWFVKFEFPISLCHSRAGGNPIMDNKKGYKSSSGKMFDSGTEYGMFPEGWEVKRFDAEIELAYGKALKEEDRIPGDILVCGSGGVVGAHNKKLASGPGIIVGRKGNAGAVFWVNRDFYPIDTAFFVKTKLPLMFVFYLLKSQNFVLGDAAVPGLNREQAYRNHILVPSINLINEFAQKVEPIRNLIGNIGNENNNLSKTRDLLIPQLVTGRRELV